MPLQIVRNDIARMQVDAIVSATTPTLLGGGVSGAIRRAAGPEFLSECAALGGCKTGEAKITKGCDLPCKYVIHTLGPVWRGGRHGEAKLLAACYQKSLALALEKGCESVAFPLISTGGFGYPKEAGLQIAVSEIGSFLMNHDMMVYLVVFDKGSFRVSKKLVADITDYIGQEYVDVHIASSDRTEMIFSPPASGYSGGFQPLQRESPEAPSLDTLDLELDESFSQMLLRKIDEKGLTDAACYKRANIDRKLFSKIRKDIHYKPSKPTAVAFAIALELSLPETRELLEKAGYALSHSFKFDLIIEYFIRKGNYDIFEINEVLFEFDQALLGG